MNRYEKIICLIKQMNMSKCLVCWLFICLYMFLLFVFVYVCLIVYVSIYRIMFVCFVQNPRCKVWKFIELELVYVDKVLQFSKPRQPADAPSHQPYRYTADTWSWVMNYLYSIKPMFWYLVSAIYAIQSQPTSYKASHVFIFRNN